MIQSGLEMFFFCLIGIVIEFAIRVLTILFPPSLKGAFYHSVIVLVLSVVIGRQVPGVMYIYTVPIASKLTLRGRECVH